MIIRPYCIQWPRQSTTSAYCNSSAFIAIHRLYAVVLLQLKQTERKLPLLADINDISPGCVQSQQFEITLKGYSTDE